jgi:hypothetical protein
VSIILVMLDMCPSIDAIRASKDSARWVFLSVSALTFEIHHFARKMARPAAKFVGPGSKTPERIEETGLLQAAYCSTR